MENLGKTAITAIIIATGLLVVDLFLCMIALVLPSIAADTNYENTVVGILITALSLVIIAVVVVIIKIIRNLYE